MEGYFKVHRKILNSQVFAHQIALKIWIWCLAKVTFKERFVSVKINRGETIVKLLPGQFIFGRFRAEEELNIDGSTIYKWIQKFSSADFDMIKIDSNNQYSVITICKWEEYQNNDDAEVTTKEQPSNNQVTTKEQPCNTNNNDNNVNKEKNVKKKSVDPSFTATAFIDNSNQILVKKWYEWCDFRKAMKKPYKTTTGAAAAYNKLLKLADSNSDVAITIMNQSIENEWLGFFPLKTNNQNQRTSSGRVGKKTDTIWNEADKR